MAQRPEPIDPNLLPKDRLETLIAREVDHVVDVYQSGDIGEITMALKRVNDLVSLRDKLDPRLPAGG